MPIVRIVAILSEEVARSEANGAKIGAAWTARIIADRVGTGPRDHRSPLVDRPQESARPDDGSPRSLPTESPLLQRTYKSTLVRSRSVAAVHVLLSFAETYACFHDAARHDRRARFPGEAASPRRTHLERAPTGTAAPCSSTVDSSLRATVCPNGKSQR